MDVAIAVLRDDEDRVLIVQRNLKKHHGGFWEFPGGKLQEKETRKQAIVRIVKKELNLDIKANRIFGLIPFYYPDGKGVNLIGIECTILDGEIKLSDHEDAQWVKIDELKNWKIIMPDIGISAMLRTGLENEDKKPKYIRFSKGRFEDVPSYLVKNEIIMY